MHAGPPIERSEGRDMGHGRSRAAKGVSQVRAGTAQGLRATAWRCTGTSLLTLALEARGRGARDRASLTSSHSFRTAWTANHQTTVIDMATWQHGKAVQSIRHGKAMKSIRFMAHRTGPQRRVLRSRAKIPRFVRVHKLMTVANF